MKLLIALGLICASPLALAHNAEVLTFKNFTAEAHFTQGPVVKTESKMELTFLDANGAEVDPAAEITVSLYMPEHRHGSTETEISLIDTGVYEVNEMYFTMGGKWRVDVELVYQDGSKELQSFFLELEDGGHKH